MDTFMGDIFFFIKEHIVVSIFLVVYILLNVFQKLLRKKYLYYIKKRAKILIVDDEDFPYLVLLRRAGYKIKKIEDIDTEVMRAIMESKYRLVLLDIKGVGKKYNCSDGLDMLKYIKERHPSQKILIFSCNDYNLTTSRIMDLADGKIGKDESILEFQNQIDINLLSNFDKYYSFILILSKILRFMKNGTNING